MPYQCGTVSSGVNPKIFIPFSFLDAISARTSSLTGMFAGPYGHAQT
jgi:hypothetical protein